MKMPCLRSSVHGLNLHREDILSDERFKRIAARSRTELDIDVKGLYNERVKGIYSEIVRYATLAQSQFSLSPGAVDAFTRIKLANRSSVETIKEIRGIRRNVTRYMASDNTDIRKQYDRLRKKVVKVLREVNRTREDDDPESHLERLERFRQAADRDDVLIDGTLDTLIREQRITSEMATSLANDAHAVARISKHLIDTAELLYIDRDTLMRSTEAVAAE